MKTLIYTFLLSTAVMASGQSAITILSKSISYHAPSGDWSTVNNRFYFDETRPDNSVRKTTVDIDNTTGYFLMNRDSEVIAGAKMDSCFVIKGDIPCDRASTMRNYYLYLWGLPMKLLDAGTTLNEEVTTMTLKNDEVFLISVDYEKDSWTFFIDQNTYQLRAYKFLKPDQTGEIIYLEGEVETAGFRIPKSRSWYTIPEDKFLGTDILTKIGEIPED